MSDGCSPASPSSAAVAPRRWSKRSVPPISTRSSRSSTRASCASDTTAPASRASPCWRRSGSTQTRSCKRPKQRKGHAAATPTTCFGSRNRPTASGAHDSRSGSSVSKPSSTTCAAPWTGSRRSTLRPPRPWPTASPGSCGCAAIPVRAGRGSSASWRTLTCRSRCGRQRWSTWQRFPVTRATPARSGSPRSTRLRSTSSSATS
jgi:hypothetical protein